MPVPYTFATATTAIPLSQLDNNFATAITLGNTAIQLGNTVTTLNNMTLANVTISSGTVSITNVAVTTANVSGTANISTLVVVGNSTMGGNVSVGGNVSISVNTSVSGNASVTGNVSAAGGSFSSVTSSGDVTLSGGTANGVLYLNGSKVATSGSALTFDGSTLTETNATSAANLVLNNTVSGKQTYINFTAGATVLNSVYRPATTNDFQFDANYGSIVWGIGSAGTASEQMRLTSTGLGIGTSNPLTKLVVSNAGAEGLEVSPTTGIVRLTAYNRSGGGYTSLSLIGTSGITQTIGSTGIDFNSQMLLNSSGNLGLGVTPSAWNSSFRAMQLGNSGYLFGRASQTQMEMGNNAVFDATDTRWEYITTNTAQRYLQDGTSGSHQWFTAASGTAGNAITFTQALTLDAGGNLLLGTTSLGTSYGATAGVLKQTGGVWTDRGQFTASGGSTTTFLTLANASNNQSYIVSVRQSGAGGNFVSAFVVAYGGSCSAVRFAQDNTNPVLDMNVTVSGLDLRLVLGSGFGSTTWDWVITRLG